MPRLLQNTRRRRPAEPQDDDPASDQADDQADDAELPPYEPLSFSLNDASRQALLEISNNRNTRKYEQHIVKSLALLKSSIGAANDRQVYRTEHAGEYAARRQERNVAEKTDAEVAAEECAEKLGRDVTVLTGQSEAALREIIDFRAELQDEKAVLQEVHGRVETEQPRPPPPQRQPRAAARRNAGRGDSDEENGEDDGDDSAARAEREDAEAEEAEEKPPPTSVGEHLEAVRKTKAEEYASMSMFERYSRDNDYISFRRTLHDAQNPDGVPLPDASTWFDQDGNPRGLINNGERTADEGEEDLVIEREVLSHRCPLTLQTISEPYTSRVCNHTFEKSAILMFLNQNRGQSSCPVCPATIRVADFFLDEVMQRKIKRAQAAQAARDASDDGSDSEPELDADGANDESVVVDRSNGVKREKSKGQVAAEDGEDE